MAKLTETVVSSLLSYVLKIIIGAVFFAPFLIGASLGVAGYFSGNLFLLIVGLGLVLTVVCLGGSLAGRLRGLR